MLGFLAFAFDVVEVVEDCREILAALGGAPGERRP
jgi:hypothetical protein